MHKRYFIFFIVCIALLASQTAFALEAQYPNFPLAPGGAGPQVQGENLVKYLEYVFVFAISTVAIFAVISMVISGFKILMYAGNPQVIGEARENIFGSVLGIILLLFSVILLRTINPDLVSQRTIPLPMLHGFFYIKNTGIINENDYKVVPSQASYFAEENTDNIDPQFSKLFYNCQNDGRTLLVWLYSEPFWEIDRTKNGQANVTTKEIPCDSQDNTIDFRNPAAPVRSFIATYKNTGVYFYLKDNCEGISSYRLGDEGRAAIPSFDWKEDESQAPRSMKIVGPPAGVFNPLWHGAVLHNWNGECSAPLVNPNPVGDICITGNSWPKDILGDPYEPTEATFFYPDLTWQNYISPTRKVTLKSDNLFTDITSDDIELFTSYNANPDEILQHPDRFALEGGEYHNGPSDTGRCNNRDKPCLKSIKTPFSAHSFQVFLSAGNELNGDIDCKMTTDPDELLFTDDLPNGRKIYRMDIVSTR